MPIEILRPIGVPVGGADVAVSPAGTPPWVAVDPGDPIAHDDSSSIVFLRTDGHSTLDLLMSPLRASATSIRSVTVWIRWGNNDRPGINSVEMRAVLNGVEGDPAFVYELPSVAILGAPPIFYTYPDNAQSSSNIVEPPLLPRPGGGEWSISELSSLQLRVTGSDPGATGNLQLTSVWALVDFAAVPMRLVYARALAAMRLRRERTPQHRLKLPVSLDQLDHELGDQVQLSHFALPRKGATVPAQIRKIELDLHNLKLVHTYEVRRQYLVLDWHVSVSRTATTARNEGGVRLTRGSYFFARDSEAWVRDPASEQVVLIRSDVGKFDVDGLLLEGSSAGNVLENAGFQDGLATAWQSAGIGQVYDTDVRLFERDDLGSVMLPAGASVAQSGAEFGADSRVSVSVDHVEASGAVLELQLVRESDGFYWSGAAWVVPESSVDLPARSTWARDALRNLDIGAAASRVRVRAQARGGVARVGLIQLEASRWPSSRKVSPGARSADELYLTNASGARVWEPGAGSYRAQIQLLWASGDLPAGAVRTIVFVSQDSDTYEWIFLTPTQLVYRRRRAGVNYEATVAAAVLPDTNYVLGARWTRSHVLSVFWSGVKGVDIDAGGALVLGDSSLLWRGSRGVDMDPLDGVFRYHEVTQQVLSDAEFGQYP